MLLIYIYFNIYLCIFCVCMFCVFIGLYNKLHKMHGAYIKTVLIILPTKEVLKAVA